MNFNIYNCLILAGVLQGFIFTIVAFTSKKYRSKSTLFLTWLILSYSVSNLMYVLPDLGALPLETMYTYIFFPFASIIPVLIYFYVLYFLRPELKIRSTTKLLFLPFIVVTLALLFFRVPYIFGYRNEAFYAPFNPIIIYHEIFSVLYSIVLLIASLLKVYNYEKEFAQFKIDKIRQNLIWLKCILYIIFFFTLVWAYLTYQNNFGTIGEKSFYILWVAMAAMIYILGYIGIYKFGILKERKKIRKFSLSQRSDIEDHHSSNKHVIALQALLIDNKLYLDSRLSLNDVAKKLQLNPSYLSRLISSEMETSFTGYVNMLRINEAKTYLVNPEFSNYTITSIGLEAGFNSKSSFYEVFKKTTGQTPYSYKRQAPKS